MNPIEESFGELRAAIASGSLRAFVWTDDPKIFLDYIVGAAPTRVLWTGLALDTPRQGFRPMLCGVALNVEHVSDQDLLVVRETARLACAMEGARAWEHACSTLPDLSAYVRERFYTIMTSILTGRADPQRLERDIEVLRFGILGQSPWGSLDPERRRDMVDRSEQHHCELVAQGFTEQEAMQEMDRIARESTDLAHEALRYIQMVQGSFLATSRFRASWRRQATRDFGLPCLWTLLSQTGPVRSA